MTWIAAILPLLAISGTALGAERQFRRITLTDGRDIALFSGDVFQHSYYDHIQLEVLAGATVDAREAIDAGEAPVVARARSAPGR